MAKVVELSDYGDSNPRKPKKIEGKRKSADDPKPQIDKPRKSLKAKPGTSSKNVKQLPAKKEAKQLPLKKAATSVEDLDSQFIEVLSGIPDSVKQENEQIQEYLRMFSKLKRIARMTERQVIQNKSTRGIYPLMQVYREMREVIADLRALRDVGQMGELLNDEVLNPFAQSCVTSIVNLRKALLIGAKNTISNPSELTDYINVIDSTIRSAGIEIDTSYRNSLSKTITVFNGG
jgi:hypothetical protein